MGQPASLPRSSLDPSSVLKGTQYQILPGQAALAIAVMKRPQRTIDQVVFSSLFLTEELTFSGVTNTDKHGKAGRDPVKHPSIRRPVLR